MVAFRFPNKPLKKILGIPMIEHAYERSKLFKNWQNLYLTTPDSQIKNFCKKKIPVIMTSKKQKDKYLTKF
jgi:CMP-2-keto-3-deoxyoctulosonic acid synthetase